MTSSLRPLRAFGNLGMAIRLAFIAGSLAAATAQADTVCLVAPNGSDVYVRDAQGQRLDVSWESFQTAQVATDALSDSSRRILFVETQEGSGFVSRAVVKSAAECDADRGEGPSPSDPTPPVSPEPPVEPKPNPEPAPLPPSRSARSGMQDPFGCGTGAAASQCNRDALQVAATRGKSCSGYSEARKIVFFKVDVREGADGPWLQSVYSDDSLKLRDGRMPDASVFNIEHTWPQSKLKTYPDFGNTKADMYHLFAVESRINGRRGNLPFREVSGEPSGQGRQPEFGDGGFEAPEQHKGMVARAMFYMATAYDLEIDPTQERVLRDWHARFPVSEEERERGRRVEANQGNVNPFIENPEYVGLVADF